MCKRLLKGIIHLALVAFLTIITQIGGLLYLLSLLLIHPKANNRRIKRLGAFAALYLSSTFLIVPHIAPMFGREKIQESKNLKAHSFFYKWANRNYVRPELNHSLHQIANEFEKQHSGIKLKYLDANFPFIDNFPLLPHLSHDDGKKIDVTLIYEDEQGQVTNQKPSISGYGVYEKPKPNEFDQNAICKQRGYWQYDIPQYLSFGTIHQGIEFSEAGSRDLANLIVKQKSTGKLFIEPHLKSRLNLTSHKVRFHGCQAVRHDDHIHFQLK